MAELDIEVSSHIALPLSQLDKDTIEGLAEYVSIENEQKSVAIKEHVWGAKKLPDDIAVWDYDETHLLLPRGFLTELLELVEGNVDYEIQDQRVTSSSLLLDGSDIVSTLRTDQRRAVEAIKREEQGIVNANPGRGKTVIALAAIAELKQKTLIIVDKSNIAKQWQERAKEHLDLDIGLIGDTQWDERDVTVALQQTLWSRREELDKACWWDQWGMVILDECHHLPALTFFDIVSKFPAKYRIGLSATVGKTPAKARTAVLTLGQIIHKDDSVDVKPTVEIVDTNFVFEYHGTYKNSEGKTVRNNYQKLINSVVKDQRRNYTIAAKLEENLDHCNLVLSKRLNHLDALKECAIELGFPEDRCWMLTGKESSDERMEIYEKADSGSCAIFSTIADEALDIPRIDRVYLAFPQKNHETIKQQIGRATRSHDQKDGAIVYDFRDKEVGVLKSQFNNRLRNLYQPMKLTVELSQ